jgi:hypothetical protein
MDNFSMLLRFFSKLSFLQIILMLLSALILFLGPVLVKRKYLRRAGLEVNERIENRNEWILFPKQYNFNERALMILIFISSFFLVVLLVNINR